VSLKALSASAPTRAFYRRVIGNVFGARGRGASAPSATYFNRSLLLVQLCRKYGTFGDSARAVEVGTGWIHFFSLVLRSVFDVRISLVDAWDNRQFTALQRQFGAMEGPLLSKFDLGPSEIERARSVLQRIQSARSFDEVYRSLGFEYVLDSTLESFPDASQDLVFSFHTLEHLTHDIVETHLANMFRILRPGGMQIHQIGLDDHLAHYDSSAHPKRFLRYPDSTWRRLFQNRLQFVNRLQRSEWHALFERSGMTVLETLDVRCDLSGVRIHPQFTRFERDDLACVFTTLVLRKPA